MLEGLHALSILTYNTDYRQVFLLFKTLDRSLWPNRLTESRTTYETLNSRYLRAIHHPDEFESSEDPLSENAEVHPPLLPCPARLEYQTLTIY